LRRARRLGGAGTSQREIGQKLSVSSSLVHQEIKRLGLPRRGSGLQTSLPGVGGKPRPTKTKSSAPENSVRELEGTKEGGRRGENAAEVLSSEGTESTEPAAPQANDGEERACRVGELETPALAPKETQRRRRGSGVGLTRLTAHADVGKCATGRSLGVDDRVRMSETEPARSSHRSARESSGHCGCIMFASFRALLRSPALRTRGGFAGRRGAPEERCCGTR
jgi:hypothetical protein